MLGQTLNNRYKLTEEFSSDPLCTLYKAQDIQNNIPVFVTTLSEKALSRPLEVQLRFKRAVEQTSKLNHPNLLKTILISESEKQTILVQEYFESQALTKFLNQAWDIDKAVDLILQIASVLELSHQQNLLHQAIQPQNILISQTQPQAAKLYDFGFSILKDISRITEKEDIISTFGYLSPESSGILRKPIDARSDIYSLGILFYQLLTGRLPYIAEDISSLIHQHIATKPTPPSKLNSSVPPVLDNIIIRLIAKEPTERYQSLKGLIHDLKEYQKQRKEGRELIDFEIARADRLAQLSFSTRLIGRDKELNQLNSLLDKTKQAQGSLCLVFGEPGIGKSRLVDELRSSVHSLNGIFCGGKCYQYEFRTPYKVFSESLDAYIEKIKRLSQAEQQEHIKRIKEALGELGGEAVKIAPSIVDIIGQPSKLVELEPEKEKIRFLITVTNFLASLSAHDSPLLMFLDDLQWVDDGSLEILERFAEKLQNLPILLIVSYRDTEVDQTHPLAQLIKKLKEQNAPLSEIPVNFFSLSETSQMISQIVMEKEEAVLPLAQELNERTKGNPFFTLELLHSLVDSQVIYLKEDHYIYNLDKLKTASLPTTIVEAVLKRMEDLAEESAQILSYASVMGRQIDFNLLTELTQKPIERILASIENGIQNQLLYRDLTGRENIFFIHDRIREAFYERVSEEERVPLHKHIAEVIEIQNKDNLDTVIYDLAYHFTQGKVEDKTLQYSIPAGHKAKSAYAHNLAIGFYKTAKEIFEKQNKTNVPGYVNILENLGEVYRVVGKYEESIQYLKECESLIPTQDAIHKSQVLSKIGDTFFEKGETENSAKALENALKLLRVKVLSSKSGVVTGIAKEFIRQMLHAWFPKTFVSNKYAASERDLAIAKLLNRLTHIYYFTDMNKAFYLFLKCLNLSEKFGPCSVLAYNYATGAAVWAVFPWFSRAFRDANKGLKMAQDLGDKMVEGCAYAVLSWCLFLNNKPSDSIQYAQKAISLLKGLGEYWDLSVALTSRSFSDYYFGKVKDGVRDAQEFINIAREVKALQSLGWALNQQGQVLSLIGESLNEVIEGMKDGIELAKQAKDESSVAENTAFLTFAYLRNQNYSQAIDNVEYATKSFLKHYSAYGGIVAPIGAQVYLDTIVSTPNLLRDDRNKYLKRAKWFCSKANMWSLFYKFFYGWSLQVNGTYYWLTGKKKRAIKTWDKALHWLRTNKNNPGGDKYRIAYILLEEAKFLLEDDPRDKKALGNLLEAKELFSSMGCKLDLETCNKLLSKIMPSGEGMESREALTQRRHLESLLSTTRAIGSVFVLDELLSKIMDYAIKVTGAERGFLLLYDEKTNQLNLKISHLTQVQAQEGTQVPTPEPSQAFSLENYKLSLELIRESEKAKDTILASSEQAPSPKIQTELKNYSIKQALSAYLQARDKPIGIIYLDNSLSGGTFQKQELELMQSFAVQASVSIENAHLVADLIDQARLRQEMELGREIQMDLLPKTTPTIPGIKVTGLMLPAKEIGGDYYDFLVQRAGSPSHRVTTPPVQQGSPDTQLPSVPEDRLSVVIGDVSGKGVAAGLLMAMVKTCLYALNKQLSSPKAILLSTNQMLYEHIAAKKFMTMLYLTWQPDSRTLTYSSAGHEHILVYRAQGLPSHPVTQSPSATGSPGHNVTTSQVESILSGGFMLGMIPDIDQFLEDRQLNLNPGDKVILYTDGVTEARNPDEELFSLKRLTQLIEKHGSKPASELLETIKSEVYNFIGTREQYDDITLVVMEAT